MEAFPCKHATYHFCLWILLTICIFSAKCSYSGLAMARDDCQGGDEHDRERCNRGGRGDRDGNGGFGNGPGGDNRGGGDNQGRFGNGPGTAGGRGGGGNGFGNGGSGNGFGNGGNGNGGGFGNGPGFNPGGGGGTGFGNGGPGNGFGNGGNGNGIGFGNGPGSNPGGGGGNGFGNGGSGNGFGNGGNGNGVGFGNAPGSNPGGGGGNGFGNGGSGNGFGNGGNGGGGSNQGAVGAGGLRVGYYSQSCPAAETIVRAAFTGSILSDPTAPAALLRLVFHDCQVGGCDASILLDTGGSDTSELLSQKNFGIRRLDFIDQIKSTLEGSCPGTVSCADIIALVGREAISISGGPRISVETGRRDGVFASNLDADTSLPPASVSVDNFLNIFQSKGMTVQESVAILGAHTIGIGHCINVIDRLYPTTEADLGTAFSSQLKFQCPTANPQFINNNTVINNDLTNLIFDNQYFRDVMSGRGLFFIDSQLGLDQRTSGIVASFAANRQLFFDTFSSAFIKLTATNVLTGNAGQIRTNCHFTV